MPSKNTITLVLIITECQKIANLHCTKGTSRHSTIDIWTGVPHLCTNLVYCRGYEQVTTGDGPLPSFSILYLNHADRPVEAGGLLRCWMVQQQQPGGEDGEGSGNGNTVSSSLNESISALSSSSSPASSASFMRDVEPIGRTLLIFQSDTIEHMVLPSSVDRYALTSWIDSRINVCS
jgi:hypothetical protein